MPNAEPRTIESTGECLTVEQREAATRRAIADELARIEEQLWTLGKRKNAIVRCQTTERGRPCNSPATHVVEGSVVRRHVTCDYHAQRWREVDQHGMVVPQVSKLPSQPQQTGLLDAAAG